MEITSCWALLVLFIFGLLHASSSQGCNVVELKGLRYHTTRRGRYENTDQQCGNERRNRTVFRQEKGSSYLYYQNRVDQQGLWAGWEVGSTVCDGTGQVRVEDESVYPDNITAIWEELSYASGEWEINLSIVIVCAGLLSTAAIISITMAVLFLLIVMATILTRHYKLKKQSRNGGQIGGIRASDVVNNATEIGPETFVPPSMLTLPDYEECISDVPPAYEDIMATDCDAITGNDVTESDVTAGGNTTENSEPAGNDITETESYITPGNDITEGTNITSVRSDDANSDKTNADMTDAHNSNEEEIVHLNDVTQSNGSNIDNTDDGSANCNCDDTASAEGEGHEIIATVDL